MSTSPCRTEIFQTALCIIAVSNTCAGRSVREAGTLRKLTLKHVGCILAGALNLALVHVSRRGERNTNRQDDVASRVLRDPGGNIVHASVNNDPRIIDIMMLGYLSTSEVPHWEL